MVCNFQNNAVAVTFCSSPYVVGACPTAGFSGCCVTTSTAPGPTETAGSCYYTAAAASYSETLCTGPGQAWFPTFP